MALTFDDLPYVFVAPESAQESSPATASATAILQALRAHGAPAVAFVNEGKLEGPSHNALVAVLQQWVTAGVILGNHTYSHADFNTVTVEQFEEEILKGEVVSRELMKARQPYQFYFRHPQTHTGDTLAKKHAIEQFVASRGYRIAPHTIDSSDFIFNVGFIRTRGSDAATAARVRAAYLDFVLQATAFAERISTEMFGHVIPQTVLLHANALNASTLDELLDRLARRGYRFVSLDEAMRDPAYRTPDTCVTRFGPTWLWRWMKSRGMALSFKDDPDPPDWVMKLYNARP